MHPMDLPEDNLTTLPQPLFIPESLSTQPGFVEKFCGFIPILGWIVAANLASRRMQPVLEALRTQLEERERGNEVTYFENEGDRKLRKFLANAIQDHFGWPDALLVPDDPLELLYYADDGESLDLCEEIERFLELPEGVVTPEEVCSLTFGQAVTRLSQHCRDRRHK